jgi:V/A-type H+-transporting ATPase subunit E
MSIYDKIAKKGQNESALIRQEAEQEARIVEHKIISEAEKEASLIIAKAEDERQNAVVQKQALSELEKRQSVSAIKNKMIDEIFDGVLAYFANLKGAELLSFVISQIKSEHLKGDETMRVNARDYEKYISALSSHKAAKKVELDILNKALGHDFALSLENISSHEEDGFLLVGETYDLNFSVKPLLRKIRKEKEKELFITLFGEEGK